MWRFLKYAVLHQGISEELSNIIDAWVEAHVVVKKTKQLVSAIRLPSLCYVLTIDSLGET